MIFERSLLTIPNSATINTADFSVVASAACFCGTQNVGMRLSVLAPASDNAPALSATNVIASSGLTSSVYNINYTNSWTNGARYTLVSPVNVVQEIVNRAGWASGNQFNLLVRWDNAYSPGTTNNRCMSQADNGTSTAPRLAGTYTNFTNSIKYTNISLSAFGSCAKWDKLLTNENTAGCGSCSVNYKVYQAGGSTILAQGTGAIDLSGITAPTLDLVIDIKRDNGTPMINDFTFTTSSNTTAALKTTIVSGAVNTCEDISTGWTYYLDPADNTKRIFGVKWGSQNQTAKCASTVEIGPTSAYHYDEKGMPGNARKRHASYTMKRYWNVNTQGNNLNQAVSVKFYFDVNDSIDILNARDARLATINSTPASYDQSFPVQFMWFKTVGQQFSHSLMNSGNDFTFAYEPLTVADRGTENGVDYVVFNNISSFSGGTGGFGFSPSPGTPLPVTILYLKATPVENSYIKLDWATASERGNKGFAIERSEDGRTWTTIGWVDGNGTTTSVSNYSFDDLQVAQNVVYYYRLRQTDFNGSEELSNIVSAKILGEDKFEISEFIPNKVEGSTKVIVNSSKDRTISVRVNNMLGQVVFERKYEVEAGINALNFDFSHLASGTYSTQFSSAGEITGKKFIVVR